jgi:hypothetical protein
LSLKCGPPGRRRAQFVGAACAALGVLGASRVAGAAPQWSAGVDPAVCVQQQDGAEDRVLFCGAAHGDLILGRQRERDLGFGPYATLGTVAFDDLRATLGASLLIPTWDDLALVLSVGGLVDDSANFGAEGAAFFGIRSYNFHGAYNFGAGLVLDAERTFGDHPSTVLSLGVRVDGLALALPFLLLWGALQ